MRIRTAATSATAAAALLLTAACSGDQDEPADEDQAAPVVTTEPVTAAPDPDEGQETEAEAESDPDAPHPVMADPGPPPTDWDGVAQEAAWGIEVDWPPPAVAGEQLLATVQVDDQTLRLIGYDPVDGSITTDVLLEAPEGADLASGSLLLEGLGPDHVFVRWDGLFVSVHSLADGSQIAAVESWGSNPLAASPVGGVGGEVEGDTVRHVDIAGNLAVFHPGGMIETSSTRPMLVHDGQAVEVSRDTVLQVSSIEMWYLAQVAESAAVLGVENIDFAQHVQAAPIDPATGEIGEITTCPTPEGLGLPVVSAGGTWLQYGTARMEISTGTVECLDETAANPVMVGDDGSSWVSVEGGVAQVAPGESTPGDPVSGSVPFALTQDNVIFSSEGAGLISYPRQD